MTDDAEHARQLIAQAEAADAEYKVAAVRAEVYTFLHRHGRSTSASYQVAIELAASLRMIVDDLGDEPPHDPLTLPADEHALVKRIVGGLCSHVTEDVDWQGRAEAAEAKLAALRTVLLEGGQDAGTARRRALAIIAGEEEDRDA